MYTQMVQKLLNYILPLPLLTISPPTSPSPLPSHFTLPTPLPLHPPHSPSTSPSPLPSHFTLPTPLTHISLHTSLPLGLARLPAQLFWRVVLQSWKDRVTLSATTSHSSGAHVTAEHAKDTSHATCGVGVSVTVQLRYRHMPHVGWACL